MGVLVQAIQRHPQTQVVLQATTAEVTPPPVQTPADAQQGASHRLSAENDMADVTSPKDFQAGVLTHAKRLALTYRSQKKVLLWDLVLSLQGG